MAEEKRDKKTEQAAPKPEKRERAATAVDPVTSAATWRADLSSWAAMDVQQSIRDMMAKVAPIDSEAYQRVLRGYNEELERSLRAMRVTVGEDWRQRISIQPQIQELESEMGKLRAAADKAAKALLTEKASGKEKEEQIQQLEAALKGLNEKQALAHLLARVGEAAQQKLLASEEFRAEFTNDVPRNAYVLSIDIRRSTELMLKAREPKLFAQFIITLATRMRQVIIDSFGIFDKFTGDGILAFFPDFYSGEHAGYLCLSAAAKCHEVFALTYRQHRHCFMSVLADTGLGIGIDYGPVQLVQLGGDFTVVGAPVVYACRMSGCTAGETFANEPAFEELFGRFSEYCDFDETELEIKREGRTVAHRARLNGKAFTAKPPGWLSV